ncbi:MAG: DUF169 domain-containing protein [Methanoregula sp.]
MPGMRENILCDLRETQVQWGSVGLRTPGNSTTLKSGDFYFKLGKYNSAAACKRTIEKVPYLGTGDTFATLYDPLEKTPSSRMSS